MTRMRVLTTLPDNRLGGPQMRALSVAKQLQNVDIETSFLVPHTHGEFPDQARKSGFTVHQLTIPRPRSARRLRDNIKFLMNIRSSTASIERFLESEQFDAVHVNGPLSFQAALAAKRSRCALLWHFNDTLTPKPLRWVAAKAASRWADQILVAADAVQDLYFNATSVTRTVYPPVDMSQFQPKYDSDVLRKDLEIPSDSFLIASVGNLNRIKGQDILLKSLQDIIDENNSIYVILAGAPIDSQRQYYKRLQGLVSKYNLDDTVEFLGYRDDIPTILAESDLFVLPSRSEACPMVVLEAMAAKTPVVAAAVGGVPEQIPSSDYGWTVEPENSNSLACAINEAYENPRERSSRSKNAYQRVEQKFSLDVVVKHHIDAYQAAVSSIRT